MSYVGIGNRQDYIADFPTQSFNGDGSTTTFTLNFEAVTGSVRVAVDNVLQPADGTSYYTNGNSITFTSAPATGTANITVTYLGTVRNVSSVSDGAITTAKLADGAVTAAKLSYDYNAYRNLIINGDMSIAQRGTSATGLGNGDSGYHTVDRWSFIEAGAPTFEFTQTQDTDVPTGQGFATSLKMDCTTAQGSLAASDASYITQIIESQNLQYIKKGTANAESLTVSFWVKSNKTGTYIVGLQEFQNTRYIANSYTINSANTWEKKTITFAGDTTGTLTNDNSASLYLQFYLLAGTDYTSGTLATAWESTVNANRAVGQVNLADNTANNFWITGVQLEAGTSASDFEFLPYDVNLQRCQRYYQIIAEGNNQYFSNGFYYTATDLRSVYIHPVIMRASPSIDQVSGTNYYRFYRDNSNDGFDDFNTVITNNSQSLLINNTDMSGTAGQSGYIATNDSNSYLALTAEL